MKPGNKHWLALAFVSFASVHGAEVTLNTADTLGNSSFNAAGGWSVAAAPSSGNTYVVPITRLRTPAASADYTFAGDSLKITTATGNMSYKTVGSRTITVNNLILDGGFIDHLQGSTEVFTLAGNLTVTGTGSIIRAQQGPITINSAISGTGDLTLQSAGSGFVLTLGGTNTHTGNLVVSTNQTNASTVLATTGQLSFNIGASGVNNTISGNGKITLNGSFNINLAGAGTTIGNSWPLLNSATLTETYGAAFNLAGFISDGGTAGSRLWTRNNSGVFYQFNEATGVLSVINPDSDGDGLADAWEDQYFGDGNGTATVEELALQNGAGDPDFDGANNEAEETAGTDPTLDTSWPDADTDGLKDAWEVTFFGNIAAQGATADPDGDHNSNLAEFTAGTDPNSAASWPDSDFDGMNDGWETAFFTNLSKDGSLDSDSDGFTDQEEHDAHTNPAAGNLSPVWSQLKHRWNFNGNLNDSVGGSHATIVEVGANDVFSNGTAYLLTGGARDASDYISLGANLMPKSTTPVTIELWAKQNTIQNWSRIFDFNNGTGEYLMMAWTQGTNNATDTIEFRDLVSSPTGNAINSLFINNTNQPWGTTAEHHIVLTLEPLAGISGRTRVTVHSAPAGATTLGAAKGTGDTNLNLVNLVDALNALGYSPWAGDNTANATYNEFRIWNGGLNAWTREKLHAQGADNPAITDADNDLLPDDWETQYFTNTTTATSALADNDGDSVSNRDEFLAGSNPNNILSTPEDTDADGLADLWEIQNFTNITAQDGSGDPDNDGFTNEQEETNGTPPNSDDNDFDGLRDPWEVLYFTDASLYVGTDDPDGDTYDNETEETAGTHPNNPAFTPVDTDGDGLLDAWEVTHFTVITAQNGTGDPDLDGYTNEQEETAKSNPNDLASIPGDINGDGITDGHFLIAGDVIGTASFNSGLNWDDASAPVAGSNYYVAVDGLRTPADANPYTFAGDKLVLATGGRLIVKGDGLLTVPYLGLDGGTVLNALNSNLAFTLAGSIHVSRASTLSCNNNDIIVNAAISGTKDLTIAGIAARRVVLNAANTWTGNSVLNTAGITLGSTGTLTFKPTTNGVNNAITGTGAATLDGTFSIDLSAANTTTGNSWDLITTSGAVTYGATFAVSGFTADAGAVGARKWTSGNYQFDEASGILSVLAPASGFASWIGGFGLSEANQASGADPDNDGFSNLLEYALDGMDPTAADGPAGTITGKTVTFTKRALAVSNGDVTYAIEESTDLGAGDAWAEVVPTVNDATTISYTLPNGPTKDFARLKVTK